MHARRPTVTTAALLAVLTLAGCAGGGINTSTSTGGGTSRSTQCLNGDCTISLSGEQGFELEIGSFERPVRVGPIAGSEVTLQVRGDSATLGAGESATLGGIAFTVDSVSGRDVELSAQRA